MADLSGTFYASIGIIGYGTEWKIGADDGSPETFESVPYVRDIEPGDRTTDVTDKTHLRSTGAHREKKATIRDSGPFRVELIYTPTHESQTVAGGGSVAFVSGGLPWMWENKTERNMKLVLADASEIPFTGVITKWQVGRMGIDNIIPVMVEVTPLGDF